MTDLGELAERFTAWLRQRRPAASDLSVRVRSFASGGYSNEIIFATVSYTVGGRSEGGELVLRLPPLGPALFPAYDLGREVAVQRAAGEHGVPVPHPIEIEQDAAWLGRAFLVMPAIAGFVPGALPALDPRIAGAPEQRQRALHLGFHDVLAAIHCTPWKGSELTARLRGAESTLRDELAWWEHFAAWTFDGAPPQALLDAGTWLHARLPAHEPERCVLWGDVRLGNVIFDEERFVPRAVLDWEMASIGPAEMDLAWYTAMDEIGAHFVKKRVPGFLIRDETIAFHERALGRPLVDFRWFEIFAMFRAAALHIRTAALAADREGIARPPAEQAVVLRYLLAAIQRLG